MLYKIEYVFKGAPAYSYSIIGFILEHLSIHPARQNTGTGLAKEKSTIRSCMKTKIKSFLIMYFPEIIL